MSTLVSCNTSLFFFVSTAAFSGPSRIHMIRDAFFLTLNPEECLVYKYPMAIYIVCLKHTRRNSLEF